eukprot:scaffold17895_cov52-Phaeocystis_antarctica.AAC.1
MTFRFRQNSLQRQAFSPSKRSLWIMASRASACKVMPALIFHRSDLVTTMMMIAPLGSTATIQAPLLR